MKMAGRSEIGPYIAIYGLVFVSVVLVNRTLPDVRWLADIFMIPGQALLGIMAGLGLALAARRLALPAALGLALLLAGAHYRGLDRSGDFAAYDYGRDLLDSLAPSALYLSDGDFHFMPLIYHRQVAGRRRDVEPLISSLLKEPRYLRRAMVDEPGRPRAVSAYHPSLPDSLFSAAPLVQRGLVMRPAAPGTGPEMVFRHLWPLRGDLRRGGLSEPATRQLMPWYAVALVNAGNAWAAMGRPSQAAQLYAHALGVPAELPAAQIRGNLERARALSSQGKP